MWAPSPQAPSRICTAQPRARLVSCASTANGGSPTEARVALMRPTKSDSLAGLAPAGTGATSANIISQPRRIAKGPDGRLSRVGEEAELLTT